MIWSAEGQIDFVDAAIDVICNGGDPGYALGAAATRLGYSQLIVGKMLAFEKFANGGTIFEYNTDNGAEIRIQRLQKLRQCLRESISDSRISEFS